MGIGIGDFHKMHALAHEKDFCHQPTEGEKPHWQWKPGQSGNPAGRPKGSKNRGSILSQEIFDEKAAQLVVKAIEEALAGDRSLLRAAFVRAIPTPRARPLEIDIPEGASPEELEKVLDECQRALKAGEITAEEAVGVANFVRARQEARARALDLQERELRVKLLERRLAAEEAEAKAAAEGRKKRPKSWRFTPPHDRDEEAERLEKYGLTGMTMEEIRALPFWRRWPGTWSEEELLTSYTLRGIPQEKWGEALAARKAAETVSDLQKQSPAIGIQG